MCNTSKIAWTPTLLIRGHGMDAAQAGYFFGAVGLVSSFLGALTWPTLFRWWTGRGRKDALVTVFAAGRLVSWICFAMDGLTRYSTGLLTAIGVGTFFSPAPPAPPTLLLQMVTPCHHRAPKKGKRERSERR